jgi:ABC-type lipopolysaccharide export system ATPase subunit
VRIEKLQEAQKLQGIGSLMGVDEKLMTMDQEAQKMEIEKESNKLLSEIRQGQLTAAQMNSIAGEISSMTEQVESALMTDPTYIKLNEQYQKAIEKGDTGMAETVTKTA